MLPLCKYGYNCQRQDCRFEHSPEMLVYTHGEYYPPQYMEYGQHPIHDPYNYEHFAPQPPYDPYYEEEEEYIDEQEQGEHYGTYGEMETIWDDYEQDFYSFVEESQECDCCKGYPYDCACNSQTCVCFAKLDWFPQSAGCKCCNGYCFNCSSPNCKNGRCIKCNERPSTPGAPTTPQNLNPPKSVPHKINTEYKHSGIVFTEVDQKRFAKDFEDCSCCKGFVFNCSSQVCQEIGLCGCFYDHEATLDSFREFITDPPSDYLKTTRTKFIRLSLKPIMLELLVEIIVIQAVNFGPDYASVCASLCQDLVLVTPWLRKSTPAIVGSKQPTSQNQNFQVQLFSHCMKFLDAFPTDLSSCSDIERDQWDSRICNLAIFVASISENKSLTVNFLLKLFKLFLERGESDAVYTKANLEILSNAPGFSQKHFGNDFPTMLDTLKAQIDKHSLQELSAPILDKLSSKK